MAIISFLLVVKVQKVKICLFYERQVYLDLKSDVVTR